MINLQLTLIPTLSPKFPYEHLFVHSTTGRYKIDSSLKCGHKATVSDKFFLHKFYKRTYLFNNSIQQVSCLNSNTMKTRGVTEDLFLGGIRKPGLQNQKKQKKKTCTLGIEINAHNLTYQYFNAYHCANASTDSNNQG
eukprot:TRINITY_DN4375_c1_g1_i7.p4 TRINITY_DN4375_c1_g1~~TRINITY_DN4375_c1_g1_i7.p4  ORF type:complete len:138 (-),score=1.34 TRINITY_DN4375_c1_g1_i7:2376-2789(-)